MTQISLPFNPQPGDAEDISHIMGDFAAVLAVVNGVIRNDNISASAAIAYPKLNLANAIKDADVDPAAAIVLSKPGQSGAATGGIPYWNGSAWVPLPIGLDKQVLKTVVATPTWVKDTSQIVNTNTAGTGAATVETNLLLNTLQAGALAIGDTVRIRAAGTSTSSAGRRSSTRRSGAN